MRSGVKLQTLIGHVGSVQGVAVTPDGQFAVSASRDHTLKVWNLNFRTKTHALTGHNSLIERVFITPDRQVAISNSHNHVLKVWDVERGLELATLKHFIYDVWRVTMTSTGCITIFLNRRKEKEIKLGTKRGSFIVPHRILPAGWVMDVTGTLNQVEKNVKVWDGILKSWSKWQNINISDTIIRLDSNILKVWDRKKTLAIASFSGDSPLNCYTSESALDGMTIVAGDQLGRVLFLELKGRKAKGQG